MGLNKLFWQIFNGTKYSDGFDYRRWLESLAMQSYYVQ